MERILSAERCLRHRSPAGFPEQPARLRAILEHLRANGREVHEPGDDGSGSVRDDARSAAAEVHAPAYLERLQRAVARGDGLIDSADNPLSAGTWEAAWGAAECAVAAADWIAAGRDRQAFAAIRPPGHHAEHATAMGFCYLGNVAIAAQHLIGRHGLDRVAIVDFDVHHGNGTQHLFETRGDVFFASLHQYPFYPGTGAAEERGRGAGKGATLNVPLAAGSGDADYETAMIDRVLPALDRFAPQALLVSAGFDAWRDDPLGGMRVSAAAFARWGEMLRGVADEHAQGRMLAVLEGGYDLAALPSLVVEYLDGVAGSRRLP